MLKSKNNITTATWQAENTADIPCGKKKYMVYAHGYSSHIYNTNVHQISKDSIGGEYQCLNRTMTKLP